MNDTNKAPTGGQQELRAFLERYPATQVLELLQPDMLGILRGKRVMRGEFAKPFKERRQFLRRDRAARRKGQTFERIDNGGRDGDPDVDLYGRTRLRWRRCPGRRCRPPRCCSR